jgi:hypothetical protein
VDNVTALPLEKVTIAQALKRAGGVARANSVCDVPAIHVDIFPTFSHAAAALTRRSPAGHERQEEETRNTKSR